LGRKGGKSQLCSFGGLGQKGGGNRNRRRATQKKTTNGVEKRKKKKGKEERAGKKVKKGKKKSSDSTEKKGRSTAHNVHVSPVVKKKSQEGPLERPGDGMEGT